MENLFKRALLLEYFTIGYNAVEALVSLAAGTIAGSIALTGFGLDSIVESLSGFVLVWRLKKHGRIPEREEEKIEGMASRFVGVTFLMLGTYVLYESTKKILLKEIPDPSLLGIAVAALSTMVMPFLAMAKHRIGKRLGLKSLIADSKETLVCAMLSVALLIGLGANYCFGFWIADPVAGLVIVIFLMREGYELLFDIE